MTKSTNKDLCQLMLFCNDPDNGMFTNAVMGIQLESSEILSLEPLQDDDGKCALPLEINPSDGKLKIGKHTLFFEKCRDWMGNWCWFAAWVDWSFVAPLLNYLQSENWTVEEGETRLFQKWLSRTEFEMKDFHQFIER